MGSVGINNVLVTGSEGYIGAVLVPLLIKEGYVVTGIDSCFYGPSGNTGYELRIKDIRNIDASDLAGIDAIIHLAALSNDPMGALDTTLTKNINFEASVELAKKAKRSGVKRFLFSSSCSIYGITEQDFVDEQSVTSPLTEYARSKIETEKALQKLAGNTFTIGLLRNSTVYGYSPQFRDDLVVNNFVTTALSTGEIRVKSDGSPWRPLIDVRDLASVFISFLKAPKELINGEVINIGFDESNYQVRDILNIVKKVLPQCSVVYTGEHGADTRSYRVRFTKFREKFPNIKRKWPMEESVIDMIQALKKRGNARTTAFTRVTALKNLIDKNNVDNNLFRTRGEV